MGLKKNVNLNVSAISFLVVFIVSMILVLMHERSERVREQISNSSVTAKINPVPSN